MKVSLFVSGFTASLLLPALLLAASPAASLPVSSSAQSARVSSPSNLAASLASLAEEEKLAHDLYAAFAQLYPSVRQFAQIASAEERHLNALRGLLAAAGTPDPTKGLPAGVFADEGVSALYLSLLRKGSVSTAAALEVGRLVEELDIEDIDEVLASSPPASVVRVLESLRRGSVSHLAAFTGGASSSPNQPGGPGKAHAAHPNQPGRAGSR